jgi:DNA-binding NtrC family response regulator
MSALIPRVLVVDDRGEACQRLSRELERAGLDVRAAGSMREAQESARDASPDAVLVGGRLAGRSAHQMLSEFSAFFPAAPVVVLTERGDALASARALEHGAYETASEGVDRGVLVNALRRACDASRLRERSQRLQARTFGVRALSSWIAASDAAFEAARSVRSAIEGSARALLVLGERGVGKARLAAAYHAEGPGRDEPFFAVNCASIAPAELELELFGHEAGAFAAPRAPRRGLLELAGNGVVFLNEFAAAPQSVQAQLLKFLETGVVRRRGGAAELRVDARVVCSSHRDLAREVAAGRVLADLLAHLREVCVELPPLRERVEDILPLAEHFLVRASAELDRNISGLTPQACTALRAHTWAGNARELEAVVTCAVLRARGAQLESSDLPAEVAAGAHGDTAPPPSALAAFDLPAAGLDLEQLELHLLRQALERARGNRTRAARLLGLNRDRIRYRIQKFGLEAADPQEA